MTELSPLRRTLRARKAGLTRQGSDTTDVDRALRAAKLEEQILEAITGWPSLTTESRSRLAGLLLAPQTLAYTEARALTDRMRIIGADLLPLIRMAFESRADRALGYPTWSAYCNTELGDLVSRTPARERRAAITDLAAAGMSQRGILSTLRVSHRQLRIALRGTRPELVEVAS